ncbi:hypothetical protein CTZ27_10780 [Streptomyces griseocarneus]|nr:hypothetical protein CTZ27_10780 [Streptomyces griseocarneus]
MTDNTMRAPSEFSRSVAQVFDSNGGVAGAGFLVGADIVITCAHVVAAAGHGPGATVWLGFPHKGIAGHVEAEVLAGPWSAPEAGDMAVLRLSTAPTDVAPLRLGSAEGCRGHKVRAFGFPAQAPPGGHFGYATAGDLLANGGAAGPLLQLADANDLTTGFSGGPVIDETSGLVIGMVTSIAAPDQHLKGLSLAYATPTQVLRTAWPDLVEQQVRPYRGLEPFTADHADWFHGRDVAVESLLTALGGQRRVLLLLGPSGAGKSSLVQAGLLPALASGRIPGSDRWLPVLARPGQDLLAELERAGLPGAGAEGLLPAAERRLAAEPRHERLLVVVDQFEELLTQPDATDGRSPHARVAAAKALLTVVDSHAPVTLVLVMRDDFYPQLAALAPDLLESAASGLLNVPATLGVPELRAIIARPAEAVGLRLEDGLPERIITDVLAAHPARQAPITLLPPLELALSQLWERRSDGRLTHHAYQQIGEVTGSLTTWCNTAIAQLPSEHRLTARRLLTALVRPADESRAVPATRQQVPLAALRTLATGSDDEHPTAASHFDDVLAALTRHRIVTTGTATRPDGTPGEPTAELIHDALIRDWGDLRDWVAQDHRFQVWLHRTAEQHQRHSDSGLSADLLDGTALAEGTEWARRRPLPTEISAFLAASRKRRQAAARRKRRLNTTLIGILAVALVLGSLYVYQRQVTRERNAVAASRSLAQYSADQQRIDPVLAAKLALAAYDASPTQEARNALLRNYLGVTGLRRTLSGVAGGIRSFRASRDGNVVVTTSHTGRLTVFVHAVTGTVRSRQATMPVLAERALVSGDGRRAGAVLADGSIAWFDVEATGSRILGPLHRFPTGLRRPAVGKFAADLSNDGHLVAVTVSDYPDTITWWNADTGRAEGKVPAPRDASGDPRFGPDGRSLLIGTLTTRSSSTDDNSRGLTMVELPTGAARTVVDGVRSHTVSGDGTAVVTCRKEGNQITISSRKTSDGAEQGRYTGRDAGLMCGDIATDDKGLLAALKPQDLRLIDLKHGRLASRTRWNHRLLPDIHRLITSDGELLLLGSDTASLKYIDIPASDAGTVSQAITTRDGKRETAIVASGSRIQIRDTAEPGKVVAEADRPTPAWMPSAYAEPARLIKLHEESNLLADQVGKDAIAVRDASSLRQRSLITLPERPATEHAGQAHRFLFDRDGSLITSSGTVIQQWDPLTGRELSRYDAAPLGLGKESAWGVRNGPSDFTFSAYPGTAKVAIAWPGNPNITVVDLRNGRVSARYALGPDTVAVTVDPGGRYAAVLRQGSTVELWSLRPLRKELGPLPLTGMPGDKNDLGISGFLDDQGRYLYSYGNKVRIYRIGEQSYEASWDLGEEFGTSSYDIRRKPIGFSGDGHTLLFTTADNEDIQPFPLSTGAWRRALCDVIGNDEFSRGERDILPSHLPDGPLCRGN